MPQRSPVARAPRRPLTRATSALPLHRLQPAWMRFSAGAGTGGAWIDGARPEGPFPLVLESHRQSHPDQLPTHHSRGREPTGSFPAMASPWCPPAYSGLRRSVKACYQAARCVNLFRAPVIRTPIRTRSLVGGLAGQLPGRRDTAPWRRSARPGGVASAAQCSRNGPIAGWNTAASSGLRGRERGCGTVMVFLSSCGSAKAHASTPEHFRRPETLRTTASRGTGTPLSLRPRT